ncbi:MAG: Gfo/Idh/MocA family oxidoreductase [Actinobacteria bacterium]|nr:Gfo/Idh/MocA family oxidoreductase [Actinomycetota bacterium]
MENIRLAMIGAGTHSTNALYPSLNFIEGIDRVAVCDIKEGLAKETAVKYGFSKSYTDYRRMFETENIEGVIICINAKEHPAAIKESLEHGIDVFVEKPAAISPVECKEILELSRETGRFVMVDHQKRRASAYLKMKEIISRKEFGDVVMIESKQHGYPYTSLFNCLIELQIHNIDILRAFGGEVKNVNAFQTKIAANRSAITLVLEFENGVIGTTHIGTEGNRGVYCERLELVGSKGQGVFVENVRKVTHYNENDSYTWEPDWMPHLRNASLMLDGYLGNLIHFFDCISNGKEPTPNIYDEMKALEIIFETCRQLGISTDWDIVIGEK